MTDDEKMMKFGKMVFGMISDVLIVGDQAYARRTITTPDGRGGKHSIELIIARKGVADIMELAASHNFNVKDIESSSKPV